MLPLLEQSFRVREFDTRGRALHRPDVWMTDGHQGALDTEVPVVSHLHEAAWADPALRDLIEPWFIEAYEEPSSEAARSAAVVITPSSSSREQIVRSSGVSSDRVQVVPNGVDASVFRPGRRLPSALLRAGGYDPPRPYVCYVSIIHRRKNLGALCAALRDVAAQGHPHGLVVVGEAPPDGADISPLEAAIEDLRAVAPVARLKGVGEPELSAIMGNADVFCHPSLMEGFGLTALEAMASGVPVVVSDRGSLPEVVGSAGVITTPDPEAVAAALIRLIEDPVQARSLSELGRVRALTMSWEHTADRMRHALLVALGVADAPRPEAAFDGVQR